MQNIENIKKQYNDLLNQLSDPELISNQAKIKELASQKEWLEKILAKYQEIVDIKKQIEENKAILKAKEDQDLTVLAESELLQLQEKQNKLENELEGFPKTPPKDNSQNQRGEGAIIEIRAGTGGEEASLFAGDLFRMYSRYAVSRNWRQKTLDSHPTELGGIKEIIFSLKPFSKTKGENIYSLLKHEGGVHRVQRIPKTEKAGRIHTSTATVAVLPEPESTDLKISPSDLKISFYRASGPGGQYVNKTESAVRIVHLPTGLTVTSQTERNQLQNRENAMSILAARLLEKREEEAQSKIAGNRKSQIGAAKRAEKIRTYNFPQDRVTDHRIGKSWHDIEGIMNGKMESIIKAFRKADK